MLKGLAIFLTIACINPVWAETGNTPQSALAGRQEIFANACEKILPGESKSSTRVRAADKAVFLGVKKLNALENAKKILNSHDLNVMVYRLVDEYIEDLDVKTLQDDEGKVCVEVRGWLNPDNLNLVSQEFIKNETPVKEAAPEIVEKIAQEANNEVAIKPDNPENLALVHIAPLEFFNGSKSVKYTQIVEDKLFNNPYFYLTSDGEIADYVIQPKVLKAKIDALDAAHKRLQMVVVLEVSGLDKNEIVSEYQNRFVLFGAEEDEQKIAARLIKKLLQNASDGVVRKIEHQEQLKLEKNVIGRPISDMKTD